MDKEKRHPPAPHSDADRSKETIGRRPQGKSRTLHAILKSDDAPVYLTRARPHSCAVRQRRGAYQVGVWRGCGRWMSPSTSLWGHPSARSTRRRRPKHPDNAVALWNQLETDAIFDYANVVSGASNLQHQDVLRKNLIEENIRASDVDFGIVTVKFPSMEPLYMWKEDMPEGEMLDYILASSSVFPAVTPYEIHDEKFLDGGYHDVMPVSMALEKGAERIIAVNLDTTGILRKEAIEYAGDRLTIVQCHWELGSFLVFDTDNARHIMRLGYLDTLKTFGILEGYRYSFGRGQMGKRSLRPAEYTAHAFRSIRKSSTRAICLWKNWAGR